jgi:hypothetical protein
MSTLNVRLDPNDAAMAEALRHRGVVVSDVVRSAIRAEYERRVGHEARGERPSDRVRAILAELPDPPDIGASPAVDPSDRRAVQRHVARKLRRREP